ncbi:Amino-acid acetyltransferase, mitochondrial [Microsporum audouinii]
MSRKAMLQSRLLLHQHDNLRCHGYGCLPPLKRRCFSRSKTLSSSSHPTLCSRNHDRIQYPPELPDNLCHSAKEKEEDKEFFLDLLSSATTKREAKSYLSRFTPPKPPLVNTQPKEEATDDLKAVNSKEKYLDASLMSSTQANTLPAEPNLSTSKCAATETLRVALIKIKNPEMLDDQCLHGISKTLSQLSRLAMGCCIVVEVDITENDIDYRKLASAQASRIAAKIDKVHCLGARRLESVISLNAPTQRLSVLSRKSLLSPLYRGQIVVIDPIGYTNNTSKALPIPADELVLALTKELAGLEYNPELSEAAAESVQNIKQRQQEVSVERLIVLDPLGGIPSLGRGQHKSHVFINLEQEYEDIRNEITKATANQQKSALDGLNSGLKGHLANLTLLQKALALLPPSSSGLITTPQDATNLPKTRHDTLGTPTVGTRQRRNPLIHNLLTDKPVLSASLPARRRGDEKGDHAPNTQLPHSTFVKHGMPLTMIPDPRVKCWTAAHSEGSRINLDDPAIDLPRLVHLIDDSFNRKLDVNHYLDRVKNRLAGLIIAGEYEGGAILTWELPPGVPDDGSPESMARMVPYLDKFAVLKRSQGAGGVADVVFNAMVRTCFPEGVCWRSRKNNPVNKWYFERSRGTWKLPDSNWAMFWTTDNVPENEQLFEDYESVCRSIQPSWADNKKEVD